MEITKNTNLNGVVKLSEGDGEVIVAYFTANIADDKLTHSISVNITNKALIELSPENKTAYNEQYNDFVAAVRSYLV